MQKDIEDIFKEFEDFEEENVILDEISQNYSMQDQQQQEQQQQWEDQLQIKENNDNKQMDSINDIIQQFQAINKNNQNDIDDCPNSQLITEGTNIDNKQNNNEIYTIQQNMYQKIQQGNYQNSKKKRKQQPDYYINTKNIGSIESREIRKIRNS